MQLCRLTSRSQSLGLPILQNDSNYAEAIICLSVCLDSSSVQVRVFAKPVEGCRRIIVSTNIAETSITVDGVVYVVDPGFVKLKSYNAQTGIDALNIVPISRCAPDVHA